MRTVADYLALVPPEHASKPKFMATLAMALQPFADQQQFFADLPSQFDLDTAIGVQLDATGAWLGRSRYVPIPIPNAWFAFDVIGLGFDQGYWQGPYDAGTDLTRLDDDTYRRLLYAVRQANTSNGSLADMQAALNVYFVDANVFIVDTSKYPMSNTFFAFDDPARGFDAGYWYDGGPASALGSVDMQIQIAVSGALPNVVDLEILAQLLIPIRGAGVRVDWECTTVNGAPVFGLDLNNEFIAGLDVGAWGANPDFVAQNIVPVPVQYLTTESGVVITTESGEIITT